jgi:hypothetical protein
VDAIADRLLDLRESYAATLDRTTADAYRAAFAPAPRGVPALRLARRRPRGLARAVLELGAAGGLSERASFRCVRASSWRPWLRSARPSA